MVPPCFAALLRTGPCGLMPDQPTRSNGRTRRRLNLHLRSSETIFGIARPARFHPSGFLSGACCAYSSRQSQFVCVSKGQKIPFDIIIRKKGGFVNEKRSNHPRGEQALIHALEENVVVMRAGIVGGAGGNGGTIP